MMVNVKNRLCDPDIRALMTHWMYMPSEEKEMKVATRLQTDPDAFAYACCEHGKPLGLIVMRCIGMHVYEIVGISVAADKRGRGIGRGMINQTIAGAQIKTLIAETDDDAVRFYEKCGFAISCLGEKFPGTVRYRCVFR